MWRIKQKVVILMALSLLIFLPSCGESESNSVSMDDWITMSLEDGNDTIFEIALPPEFAGHQTERDEGWSAYYHTEYCEFRVHAFLLDNSEGYSQDLIHTIMGSDIQYMSEKMFEEMEVSSFFSAPESEKGEKAIYDKNWLYYSMSGASKKKNGGSVAACEYVYIRDTDFVQVVVLYSAKNEAPKEEKNLLDKWYELIPETMKASN